MNIEQMNPNDLYAVAAQTQSMPGFGFNTQDSLYPHALQYASIVSRICASIIDGLITSVSVAVIVIGLALMDHVTGGDNASESMGAATLVIVFAAILAFLWLYNVAQETSTAQATLGKRIMGIKVANLSGGRIGVPQSTIRFMAKLIPGAHPLLGLASFVANIFCLVMNSSKNRTLHDLLAGTVVISA